MEDILIINYLKEKGLLEDYVKSQMPKNKNIECADIYDKFFQDFKELTKNMHGADKDAFIDSLKTQSIEEDITSSLSKEKAQHLVSKLWSFDHSHRKCCGEYFSFEKSKEVCERYSSMLSQHISYIDVYLALNTHYHDYNTLYKSWFGENCKHQLIESAITYWFHDGKCINNEKLLKHFSLQ